VGRSDRFAVPRSARLGKRSLLFQPQGGRDPIAWVGAKRRPGFEGVTNSARGLKGRDSSGAHLRTTSRSRPAGKENFRSQTASSLPGSPGNTSRLRKTTKSSAVANRSWPGPPRTFSSWSKTPGNTRRPAAGRSLNLTMANPPTPRCTKPAFPATSPGEIATLSSPVTRLDSERRGRRATACSRTQDEADPFPVGKEPRWLQRATCGCAACS